MYQKKRFIASLLTGVALTLPVCAQAQDEVVIGFAIAESGWMGAYDGPPLKGAMMAIEQFNFGWRRIRQAPASLARSANPVGNSLLLTDGIRISRPATSSGGSSTRYQLGAEFALANRAGCHKAVQQASSPSASSPSWC